MIYLGARLSWPFDAEVLIVAQKWIGYKKEGNITGLYTDGPNNIEFMTAWNFDTSTQVYKGKKISVDKDISLGNTSIFIVANICKV